MKNNVKKIISIALSSFGILASAPSAFCLRETNERRTAPRNFHAWDETQLEMENGRYVARSYPGRVCTLQENGDLIADRYSFVFISGKVAAPHAAGIVKSNAFYEQSRITELSLPKIQGIEAYAFNGCTSLRYLALSSDLLHIDPQAFDGCNPDLIINFNGHNYTINDFLEFFSANQSLL